MNFRQANYPLFKELVGLVKLPSEKRSQKMADLQGVKGFRIPRCEKLGKEGKRWRCPS